MHAAEVGAFVTAKRDLSGARRVHARDLAVAESHADGRLLRLIQRPLGQPRGDALASGTRNWLEGAGRVAQLWQRRDGAPIDTYVHPCAIDNLAR